MGKSILPKKVKKRDGTIVRFNKRKIERAIEKAAFEVLQDKAVACDVSQAVASLVTDKLALLYGNRTAGVESVQDIVEMALMSEGYSHIAKSYILYRETRREIRRVKSALDLKDDLKLPVNTMEVLKKRYLLKDDNRRIVETPSELFRRVASAVAGAEKKFRTKKSVREWEEDFYQMMRSLEFMPNSPTLMNAGTSLGQLSACFVIPVEDSMEGIFRALKDMATIHQTGGGTGFSFSDLRPKGDMVSSTKGEASGPVSFMSIFDRATGVIVQGGRRRGANIGILRCDHPDIVEFIGAKIEQGRFPNFNLSVGITDAFMDAVKKNRDFGLVNPRTGEKARRVKARAVFDLLVNAAWRTGDPGLVFLDEINRKNPTPGVERIKATNPCGELPLLPYESCNLASINLARMVRKNSLDWQKLEQNIKRGIRFLDNVIEVNRFPLEQIKRITSANRKVGLGVMGFADMLIKLGIPYGSKRSIDLAGRLMRFIHKESLNASAALAGERGVFPNFKRSVYAKKNLRIRNATVNTIAPTGTISIIAGCSSGIEPLFGVSFVRNVLSGAKLLEINPVFEKAARERGFYSEEILADVARHGSLGGVKGVPEDIRRVFVTAFDVTPGEHLQVQAVFQRYTDNSVSKTINLPPDATVEDVRNIYMTAHRLKCKGITVYRYGTKEDQVLSFDYGDKRRSASGGDMLITGAEYSGGCVTGSCAF
ncbi:MAG: adenosylcobalamin-dependent ribonucleoside-diphosphate reductase [Candidatus Makaraimicrobium thalassicum]|nr:MAG: adenosylcobalamin-dependent ribonucleoside-diphosphate reductase [Candidatus Omnitrophota bacterium]